MMGITAICLLSFFKKHPKLKKLPSAMIVVILAIFASWALDLGAKYNFKISGTVPAGVPAPMIPKMPRHEQLGPLLTLVVVLTLIGYMESMAVSLIYAGKNGYDVNADQELIALGTANIVGSLFQCMPTAGGFGRTAVNANAGSCTQLAGIISGCLMIIVLWGFTPLFYHLPKPVLGAVVIVAVIGMCKYVFGMRVCGKSTSTCSQVCVYVCACIYVYI